MITVPLIVLFILVLLVAWLTAEQRRANTSAEMEVGPDGFVEIAELANGRVQIEKINDQMFIVRSIIDD